MKRQFHFCLKKNELLFLKFIKRIWINNVQCNIKSLVIN